MLRSGRSEAQERTWVVDNSHLAISLLDLQLGSRGLDTQSVVIGGIDDHDGRWLWVLYDWCFQVPGTRSRVQVTGREYEWLTLR